MCFFSDYQKQIIREFVVINAKLDDVSELLNLLLKNRQQPILTDIQENLDPIIKLFPLKTEIDLHQVEEFIEETNKKALVRVYFFY